MTVSINEIILYVITLLPISTLFVNQSITNKILFVLSIVTFAIAILKHMTKRIFFLLSIVVFEFVISIVVTGTLALYNTNDIFYLPLWVLFFLYFENNYKIFESTTRKHIRFVKYCIYIWECLFIVLRITNPTMNEEFSHRSASSAFLIIVMVWYISKTTHSKKFNINLLIPLLAVFIFEVRTYLIVSLVVVCMAYYSLFKKKKYFFFTIIPFIILIIYFVLQTSVGSRFTNTTESYYGGILATITSSRSVFWEADIKAFLASSLLFKIIGNGYNYIYIVNFKCVATYIWGHNDIIHILVTNGIIGLYIYFSAFFGFIKRFSKSNKYDIRLFLLAIVTIAFCALLDGLYHYICALFAIPFLINGIKKGNC